jgi:CO/xanthine dehydrogenase Mo-binding subunit
MIGARVKRVEDPRLLEGRGYYVGDVVRPGMAHAVVIRSVHAHARVLGIDAARALALPGVLCCVTPDDLRDVLRPIPFRMGARPALERFLQPPLADGVVRYVGEPVAVLVARDRAAAEDARELVDVAYAPLPAAADVEQAVEPGAPPLFPGGNVADAWTVVVGDVDGALAAAARVVSARFSIGRQTGVPIETRGLVAEWDDGAGTLTVWGATKVPYFNRQTLATMLGLDEQRIHFVAGDVGGGFGVRGEFYPEDLLVPCLARRLGRPVKWVEDRHEHFLAVNHSREQRWSLTVGVDEGGRLLGIDATLLNDMGAYVRTHGALVPSLTAAYLPGPYRLPSYRCRVSCVMTSKAPTGTVRSPGFFEGTFVRERALDMAASALGMDAAEIRRRNLVRPEEMPYAIGTALVDRLVVLQGEDFPAMFERALAAADHERLVARCREHNAGGRDVRLGVGLATVVETSGVGPFESAKAALRADGRIVVATGAPSLGQGLATTLGQVCADVLRVPLDRITVHHGDTREIAYGTGTYASRSAIMAGNAVHEAALGLRDRILDRAAARLEASPADLRLEDGDVVVVGVPDRRCSLREVAASAPPDDRGTVLEAECRYEGGGGATGFGVHVAVVAVDVATGRVRPERYLVVCDVGRAINPAIVEGQLHGGVVQGLGNAVMEEVVYDDGGQALTASLMDYAVPSAAEVPPVDVVVLEHARPASNRLGFKGAGETGTSGAGAAIANAVADALGSAVRITELPLTAARVMAAIRASGQANEPRPGA